MHNTAPSPWQIVLCDSLEKVFAEAPPRPMNTAIPLPLFAGEAAGFQVAFHPPVPSHPIESPRIHLSLTPVAGIEFEVAQVDLVPVPLPCPDDADAHYLRTTPGLYPDLLRPAPEVSAGVYHLRPVPSQWRSAWINARVTGPVDATEVVIHLIATETGTAPQEHLATLTVPIEVLGEKVPELPIPHTQWFHCDGIAQYYGDTPWSEGHWRSVDAFLGAAREMGTNMILTPVWTPPLDTTVGTYRIPTQLARITEDGGRYTFDWARLHRWLDLAEEHGFTYLEMPHLFSQWGARSAAPIYLSSGEEALGGSFPLTTPSTAPAARFGWHTPAEDPEYGAFLEQFLPALQEQLATRWDLDRVYFHISDEPLPEQLPSYRTAHAQVADLIEGRHVIDAVSDLELHDEHLVPIPVVATDRASEFHAAGVPIWLYYCVVQAKDVSNRFITLPSTRNRVIGAQLYAEGAQGFLHWGFNFYNTHHSTAHVNPFADTCAGGGFFGGDPFAVYPGPDRAAWKSIRFEVFREAILDLRLMFMLEERLAGAGRAGVLSLIDQAGNLTLDSYTYAPDHYREVTLALLRALKGAERAGT